jgi:ABC-2 type transport system permease protein
MRTMRLAFAHTRIQILELLRIPGFSVATLSFPTLLFVLFGLPRAHGDADLLLASYAAFGVLGVGFFQFGVSTAIERSTPWYVYVRTLPAPALARIAARVLSALAFATVASGLVIGVALATTSASLDAGAWLRLVAALLLGAVPFVVLGLSIAYWTTPRSALPIANVLYMLLSYTGGLWTGPADLPHAVQAISRFTPTRQWGDVLWPAVLGTSWQASHWLALAAYACAFALVAGWGYHRDEGQRFT